MASDQCKRTTDQRADLEKKVMVRAERQYKDVLGALTEVGRDMGRGQRSVLEARVGRS